MIENPLRDTEMHVVNSPLPQAPPFRLAVASIRSFRHTVAASGPHGWWAFLRSMRFDRFLLSPGMLHAQRASSKGPERPTFSPTPFFTTGPEECLGYPGSVISQSAGTGSRPCADAPRPKPPSRRTESCHQERELLPFFETSLYSSSHALKLSARRVPMDPEKTKPFSRRQFVKGAAATAGLLVVKPQSVFGAPANSAPQIGLIACGGRGLISIDNTAPTTHTLRLTR